MEMWIICLDRLSANSEKGRGSEWAVRVGQHSLFLAGAARSVLVDYREGLTIRSAGYKLCSVEKMTCS